MKFIYLKCPYCNEEIKDGALKCKFCKEDIKSVSVSDKPKRNFKKYILVVAVFIFVLGGLLSILLKNQYGGSVTDSNLKKSAPSFFASEEDQMNVQGSVVSIFCPYNNGEFSLNAAGNLGSGTIFSPEGLIITNSHVLPQDEKYLLIHKKGCIVIFPDPKTGQPNLDEIYVAEAQYYPEISDKYDLAILKIYDSYKEGIDEYGTYPRKFEAIQVPNCDTSQIQLGDPVRVFGYPSLTGGYNLTVTEGIVSAFEPETGGIITSAQITGGNSGGLAVSKNGCILGIPSAAYEEGIDAIGYIISLDIIQKFESESKSLQPIKSSDLQDGCGNNAYSDDEGYCYCESGYEWEDLNDENNLNCVYTGATVEITCGENSYEEDGACYCESGYEWEDFNDENNLNCVTVLQCGDNMFLGSDGQCHCNPGYAPNLTKPNCIKIPANAHAVDSTTDVWLCNPGYIEVGNSCFIACGINSYLDENKNQCKCLTGYIWENIYDPKNYNCIFNTL